MSATPQETPKRGDEALQRQSTQSASLDSSWYVVTPTSEEQISADRLLRAFEEGDIKGKQLIKMGLTSNPKPLARCIRELVLSSRVELQANIARDPYLELVDLAPIPTVLSDLSGRLTYSNQAFCDFIGYSLEELIGMPVSALSEPDDLEREVSLGNSVIRGERNGFGMQKCYITKSGAIKKGQLSLVMLYNAEGLPNQVLAQLIDISELESLHEQLARSQTLSALGELSRHLSHDLKNILMVLRGTLDLVQSSLEHLEDEERELVAQGLEVCQSGERLIERLLDIRPADEVTLSPLCLKDTLKALRPTLTRALSPFPLSFTSEPRADEALVMGDPVLIERLLLNLCVNARQAMEELGAQAVERRLQVSVHLREPNTRELGELGVEAGERPLISLEVSDTGPGIEPTLLRRLLEPSVSTKRGRGGHGLGLTAVSSICEQLGAHLHLSSELGVGSTFSVTFLRCALDA